MLRPALAVWMLLGAFDMASAVRVLEDVESSVELTLSWVELPASSTGAVTFKVCTSCTASAHRLEAATTYFVNGSEVSFADLLRTVGEIAATKNGAVQTLVGVFFDVHSGHVTRVALRRRS